MPGIVLILTPPITNLAAGARLQSHRLEGLLEDDEQSMADTDIGGEEVFEHLEGSIVKQDVMFDALHQKRKLNGRWRKT